MNGVAYLERVAGLSAFQKVQSQSRHYLPTSADQDREFRRGRILQPHTLIPSFPPSEMLGRLTD